MKGGVAAAYLPPNRYEAIGSNGISIWHEAA